MTDRPLNDEGMNEAERLIIKTGTSKYTFSPSWVKNDALNDILAGLVADDIKKQLDIDKDNI